MALLAKDNSKAVVLLTALTVMAIAFSSSHTAQGTHIHLQFLHHHAECNSLILCTHIYTHTKKIKLGDVLHGFVSWMRSTIQFYGPETNFGFGDKLKNLK